MREKMDRTSTKKEATHTNTRCPGTYDTDTVRLQRLINVVPDHPGSNDSRLGRAVILDSPNAVQCHEHARCRTESWIRRMSATLDL